MVIICLNTWSSFRPEHLQLLQSIIVTDTPWVSGRRDHHLQRTMQFLWGFLASCNRIRTKTAVELKGKSNNRLPWSSQHQQRSLPF